MTAIDLVMPMAGRGSRFARDGYVLPKPLVELQGRPFFAWAVDSVRASCTVAELVFVVLKEHCEVHRLDTEITDRYPEARVVRLDEVTAGAAETAALGARLLAHSDRPLAINDCDHAFDAGDMGTVLAALAADPGAGALLGFASTSPAFSYVRFDDQGDVVGTVEKSVVSPYAIAGCYLFGSSQALLDNHERYRSACAYDELFLSGVYNALLGRGGKVHFHPLRRHVPFGTPQELAAVPPGALNALPLPGAWMAPAGAAASGSSAGSRSPIDQVR